MSRLSKRLSVIFGICMVIGLLLLGIEHTYFTSKINRALNSIETPVDIDSSEEGRFKAFDTNDVSATSIVLNEVNQVGKDLANMQNQYLSLLSEYLENGSESVMTDMQKLVEDFSKYFGKNSAYNGRWYMGTVDGVVWTYYPIYDYNDSSIRLLWLCRNGDAVNGDVLCYFSALYDLNTKSFRKCMKYDTGTGVSLYGITKENPDVPKVDKEAYGKSILELAESIDAPLATHPTDGMSQEEQDAYWEGYWDSKVSNN